MTVDKVTLDTNVQLSRVAGGAERRRYCNSQLHGKQVYTTSIVLREFIRTLVCDLEYLHSSIGKLSASHPIDALFAVLSRKQEGTSERSQHRLRLYLEMTLDGVEPGVSKKRRTQLRLERMFVTWIEDFFEVVSDDNKRNRVECMTGTEQSADVIDELTSGRPFPVHPGFPNRVGAYLDEHVVEVKKARKAMKHAEAKVRDEELLSFLSSCEIDGNLRFHDRIRMDRPDHWVLGDLLLAIESLVAAPIWSDDNHFDVLCPALNKDRFVPSPI